MIEDLLEQIAGICGEAGLVTGEDLAARPADWLGQTRCGARAVVRPRCADELSRIMRLCHERGQPVVAAGGLTGLVHATDASETEIQISFERMRQIISVDPVGRTMTVEAGAPLQAVQDAAAEHGLIYAVDLGSRGSATIGGNISTNAGGNQVVCYGMTRENVLGLEAVLADGTVLSSMNRLLKNNAAYDLKQLFIGTEGTLGLVTRAVLRLHPKPRSKATAFLAADDFAQMIELFTATSRALGPMLTSFEAMWQSFYATIALDSERHQPPLPGTHPYYVLIEASGMSPDRDEELFTELMGKMLEDGLASDAVIAASESQRQALWDIREDVAALFHKLMPGKMFDISLPLTEVACYVSELETAVVREWDGEAKLVVFGHLGDGNLHIGVGPRPWNEAACHRAEELVYQPLEAIGGSVSAEHGIGLEKRDWLHVSRSPEEIATMRALKNALDPKHLLNRGKVFLPSCP